MKNGSQDQGSGGNADNLHDLLLVRRRADNLTGLEILHVVAGDSGSTTDNAAN